MKLTHCTLTGVDSRVALADIANLSTTFPLVEWGFLYSPKRQGLPGRYPSVVALQRALMELPAHVRAALHVCGHGVPDLLDGADAVVCELVDMVEARNGRVQLNFSLRAGDVALPKLAAFLDGRPRLNVIVQHNAANVGVWEALSGRPNLSMLFDASGGKEMTPEAWPLPLHPNRSGYAGGLGPHNLRDELSRIAVNIGDASIWIDMEGNLRTRDALGDDWFDLNRCRSCLEIACGVAETVTN